MRVPGAEVVPNRLKTNGERLGLVDNSKSKLGDGRGQGRADTMAVVHRCNETLG